MEKTIELELDRLNFSGVVTYTVVDTSTEDEFGVIEDSDLVINSISGKVEFLDDCGDVLAYVKVGDCTGTLYDWLLDECHGELSIGI